MTIDSLQKYVLAAIGGVIALTLPFNFTDHGVLVAAAKYTGDKPQLIKFMSDMGYPKFGEWCGEFAASIIKMAGGTPPSGAAIASNWRNYGTTDALPNLGDVAVADRGVPTGATGSHVGFVTAIDLKKGTFTLESGNSCNIYTTRQIDDFSFHRPPKQVLSVLIGDGAYLELQSVRYSQSCPLVAPGIVDHLYASDRFRARCALSRPPWSMRAAELSPLHADYNTQ